MGSLVGHLAGDAMHLGDIMKEQHCTDRVAGFSAHGRSQQFDGPIAAGTVAREDQSAPAEIDRCTALQRLSYWIDQHLAVRFIDQPCQRLHLHATRGGTADAEQIAGGRVQVVNSAACVGGDDGLAQRFQRQQCARTHPALCGLLHFGPLRRQHFHPDHQQRVLSVELHTPRTDFQARALPLLTDQIHFIAISTRLARQRTADVP